MKNKKIKIIKKYMLEYPLISTIQTLEKEDKKLLSLWLSSFLFYQLTSYVESRYRKEKSKKLISK